MFFCDSHIKQAIREHIAEPFQSGSRYHCCRYRHYIRFPVAEFSHNSRKNICIGWISIRFWKSGLYLIRCCPVKSGRMAHRRFISTAFFCQHMDQYRTLLPFCFLQHFSQLPHIVSIHRTKIGQSHIFKKHSRNHQLFDAAFCLMKCIHHAISHFGNLFQSVGYAHFQLSIRCRHPDMIQIGGHSTHIPGDRHLIIIQNNNKILL